MKTNVIDFLDFDRINILLEGFNKTTGFVTAILDLKGKVLSKSGWRNICTDFHRVHPETSVKCSLSDTKLAGKIASGEKYHYYKCLNGLIDVAVPVVINGEHVANLFTGQFFFEKPDTGFFMAQARKYGFDESLYLKNLQEVPIVSEEKAQTALKFLLNMTEMITEMTMQRIEQTRLIQSLKEKQELLSTQNNDLLSAREKANESDKILSSVLHTSMDGYLLTDMELNIREVNEAYCKMSGYSRQKLLTMGISDIEAIETEVDIVERLEKVKTRHNYRFLSKHRRNDGSTFDVEITAHYRFIGTGQIVVFIRDITEQTEHKNKLEKSEQILSLFAKYSPASIAMFDKNMCYLAVSQRFLKDYNLGNQNVIGKSHYEVFPEITNRWKKIHQRCLSGVSLHKNMDKFKRKDGRTDWTRWDIHPWYEQPDKIGGIILFSEVITRQVKADKELIESEKYNRTLFNQAVIGLAVTDLNGRLVDVNPAYAKIIGRTVDESLKLNHRDITPDNYAGLEQHQLKLLKSNGFYGPYEKEYIHKDGHLVPVKLQGLLIERQGKKFILSGIEDITLRKKTEENLRESEERLEMVLEGSQLGYWDWNIETGKVHRNSRWAEMLGFTLEEIEFNVKQWSDLHHPDDRAAAWQSIQNHLEGRTTSHILEYRMRTKDGNYKWILDQAMIVKRDSNGKPLRMSGTHRDISERIMMEEQLRKDEEQYRLLFKMNPAPMWIYELDTLKFLAVNQTAVLKYGYTEEEFSGMTLRDIRPLEDVRSLEENIHKSKSVFQNSAPWRHKTKDGKIILVEIISQAIEYSGKSARLVLANDITEREKALEALMFSEEKFFKAFHNSPDAITITKASNGLLVEVNESLENISGYSRDEVIGRTSIDLNLWINEDDRAGYVSTLREKGSITDYETQFRTKSGEIRNFVLSGELYQINGESYILGIIRDITERKKNELEIKRLNEDLEERVKIRTLQLEATNRELEAFSYSVSHDLRAPLRHINGYVDLLTRHFPGSLPEKEIDYLNVIADSSKQMGTLIDDLLSFSRTGRQEMKQTLVDMNLLIDETLKSFSQDTVKRTIRWNIGKLPSVKCDKTLIKLVWQNLIGNAIKFTQKTECAEIEIQHYENEKEFVFFVCDNGVGFNMKYSRKLFGVFQRLHSKAQFEGTGIGLANVQRIILRHEGRVWAEAELNNGATFYFTLPKNNNKSHD